MIESPIPMSDDNESITIEQSLEDWVMSHVEQWQSHYDTNYRLKHEEYYRLWRGIWSAEDKTRDSERSRIIAPALQQAVESSVAEVEEATFGRGKFFDARDDVDDPEKEDVQYIREKLHEDFDKAKFRKQVSECLVNAAVYGTGIGELVIEEITDMVPASEEMPEAGMTAVGVNVSTRTLIKLVPVLPQNFLIDPTATSIDDALGVVVDRFVPEHIVKEMQEKGIYEEGHIGRAPSDLNAEPDRELNAIYDEGKIRLTKWFGKVPRHLLAERDETVDAEGSYYVEAIVVIANEAYSMKATETPYMMQDRPVIAFPWDVVPGRFWGRGVCEKGYNSQKALDAELRARIDALALTVHPMMGMDATRVPRGMKPEVKAGKMILTNGDPREVLHPFTFGSVDQITFAQAQALQTMVQQSTGAVDATGVSGQINGEATAAGISMSLGAIIKRHKRTLLNFQQAFLIPAIEKTAWRYMQFDPERYPVADYKFHITSSLGIIAREYEVSQLVQLLQTVKQDSPMYGALIEAIVDNMSLSNREELITRLREASQPTPEQQQQAQETHQAQMRFQNSQTAALEAQAKESNNRALKLLAEMKAIPEELENDRLKALSSNLHKGGEDDDAFEKRLKVAELQLKEKDIDTKRYIAQLGKEARMESDKADRDFLNSLDGSGGTQQ